MDKKVLIILTISLLIALGIIFTGETESVQSVKVKEGVQYITINAKSGYSPKITNAAAGLPTKLLVETNGTYDCSAALVVRSAQFQEILPPTGKTEIDLGVPEAGKSVQGVCGMGMYSFTLNFN